MKRHAIRISLAGTLAGALVVSASPCGAQADATALQQRVDDLEQRLARLEHDSAGGNSAGVTGSTYNPSISLILDGVYARYENAPEDYGMPGFALGREAGLAPEGFSLGHTELIFSSNIDDRFYGQFSLAIAEHENEIEIELEEAFFETLALGGGFSLRGGRFYSGIGYLNQQHAHAWDFHDAPLVYRGLFGNQYYDDGVRVSWVAPTRLFIELGAEAFAGRQYPAGGAHAGIGSWTTYVNFGGDIGDSHSWQAGLSYWSADGIERTYSAHDHGSLVEVPQFSGDSAITGVSAVYKWAPHGNYRSSNVKLQYEYFSRNDDGTMTLLNSTPLESGTLQSSQVGWYLQGTWQFAPAWRAGIRYDQLDTDNSGSNTIVLDESGMLSNEHEPARESIMLEWTPGEYSRIRLQVNRDLSYPDTDNQFYLQYTFSMGAHGAHTF